MENEELIRQEIQAKRAALVDKLGALEDRVLGTVKEATEAVSETVEVIKDTVEGTVTAVKDSVEDTVATVKDTVKGTVSSVQETVQEGVETVKDWLDVEAHVQEHPWAMMGGSVVLGYCLGNMLKSSSLEEPASSETAVTNTGNGHHRREKRTSVVQKKGLDFGPELAKLKGLALGTLLGTARDMILPALPESMKTQVKEVFDSLTKKIGGEPIASTGLAPTAAERPRQENLTDAQKQHQKRFT